MVSTAPHPRSAADAADRAATGRTRARRSRSGSIAPTPPVDSLGSEVDARLDEDGAPAVDVAALGETLLGAWREQRLASRALTARPELHRTDGLPMKEHRLRVSEQMRVLAAEGGVHRAFPVDLGGEADHGGNIAGFEELVTADPSLQIKSGVQWGLFGAAVLHLGTRPHHEKWLPGIMSLEIPGAFAMTETGHGSDVASIATTATYEDGEFVLRTPFRAAWKDYLGNAAVDGRAAVVFAQLVTLGVNHGVHAFFVPIRDEQGAFLPGVGGEDDGLKGGLNGIDNGRLHFDGVRVPRENLLNRYGDVAADGTYSSPIASPGRRFFTMLGTLVQGRVSLDGASVAAAKIALTVAVTYGDQRRQFTGGGEREEVLLDYQRHQRRLLPRLATTYAAAFAHEKLLTAFDEVFSGANDTEQSRQDLETLAAGLKALSTWHALDTLQEAREACGGAGFLAENRLTQLRADLDVYATFEGDNTVLLQLVAKRLLTDVGRRFKGAQPAELARYAASQVAGATVDNSGLRRLAQVVADRGSTARSVGQLREDQRELLTGRVESMVAGIASRLRPASKLPSDEAARLFNAHQSELIEAARAHAELLQWEAFTEALAGVEDAGTRTVLTWLRDLFGLGLIEKHLDWYLIHGRLSSQRAVAVTSYIDRLLARIRPHAADLVASFGYGPEHVRAAIATGAEAERQEEAHAWYEAARASGTLPTPEKRR
ncbi:MULTISPECIES: acyl-CoA dehydrogenase [unclassified Rathayibacter]|jgi:acyl-CoA oxidase|uniref:acyl-CoA dehydrogenase family protein n=1 Tax=unclassified Rathayibacter TaxID=2609250 RepID=UPI000CE7B6E5|nr:MULTISPECIES: acyl-CoA dehydrogenase [unclassified Rathayibacter]PPG82271.1 acyl-CoA dehydrogenase [Rathayibacter sp. AY1E5]PPH11576.1 acyl-CoA dehydrogenase [Rathayibacter sp. AY1C1]PPH32842.1 acyl-CoA dehydrogenase [Rathayibacter sp. AY1C3]PPH61999.1 acyl-CoA dehydrogenase [Rathayibacter sp. AY1D7]PPH83575.1 acyl-CoA dehydrogenase [Rathayibacter sp. AY1D9]